MMVSIFARTLKFQQRRHDLISSPIYLFPLENDFDILGEAKEVFQDIYFCIQQVDGDKAASVLEQFITGKKGTTEETKKTPNKGMHCRNDSEYAYNNAVEACDDISSEISVLRHHSPSKRSTNSRRFSELTVSLHDSLPTPSSMRSMIEDS